MRSRRVRSCVTDGCRSRSSRLSSSATTRSPTTCPRARCPIAVCRISGSTSISTSWCSATRDHLGDPMLREAVAADAGAGVIGVDDVLVTPGAAAALFGVATSLLEPGDHMVVVRTNYATNLETPRAIGADVDVVDLDFTERWQLDIERVVARCALARRASSASRVRTTRPARCCRRARCTRSSSWPSARERSCSSTRRTAI